MSFVTFTSKIQKVPFGNNHSNLKGTILSQISTQFFDTDGTPTPALEGILTLFEVKHDRTLLSIRDATQKEWYQAGKLRAEIVEQHQEKRGEAMPLFAELGCVHEINAPIKDYLHALVLGGTVTAVRKRLAFFRKQWQEGVRFQKLFLIGSQRKLIPGKEAESVIFNPENAELPYDAPQKPPSYIPQNEADMMTAVYQQAANRFPWDMKMTLVSSGDVGERPANTEETLNTWMRMGSMGGKCLVVSSQPFVSFQQLISTKVLGRKHPRIDCIGYEFPGASVSQILDTIAKVIYELALRENK